MNNEKRTYYTNGVNETRLFSNEQIPDGWYRGRVKSTITTAGKVWVNNGDREIFVNKDEIPDGFCVGRIKFSNSHVAKQKKSFLKKKYHWFTDGTNNIVIPDSGTIPEGFHRGRCTSESLKQRLSDSAKRRKVTDTGEANRMLHSYMTKKKNGSFNTSSDEEEYYKQLLSIYGIDDIVRSYKSSLYPFNCDFYIKSEDRYIELNKHWTHGGMEFIANDQECIDKLNLWIEKSKKSKFYKNAIETWTVRDVEKFKTARMNKLNYTVIY